MKEGWVTKYEVKKKGMHIRKKKWRKADGIEKENGKGIVSGVDIFRKKARRYWQNKRDKKSEGENKKQ